MKRARLILNPISGGEQADTLHSDIVAALEAVGIQAEVALTQVDESPIGIAKQAVADGYDLVLVGGGDGTVSEVAKGLLHTSVPLGILPIGTYNNIARSLNIPTDLAEACQVVAQGHIKLVDIGQANDQQVFFEAAGIGLDAALFPLGEDIKGGQWGRLVQAAQLALSYKPQRVHIRLDRSIAEASAAVPIRRRVSWRAKRLARPELRFAVLLVVVANGPFYGAGFTIAPNAHLDDGLLTVSVFRGFSKWELLRHFWAISRGSYRYSPKIETYRVAELQISAPQARLPVHIDGNPIGELPATFKAVKQALRVIVPA